MFKVTVIGKNKLWFYRAFHLVITLGYWCINLMSDCQIGQKKIVPKDKYVLCSMSSVFGNTSDNNMDMIAAIYNSLAQT